MQTDRHSHSGSDRQTDRHTDIHTQVNRKKYTNREASRETETKNAETIRDRQTVTQSDRAPDR